MKSNDSIKNNKIDSEAYYPKSDLIGTTLSNWRTKAVLPYIKGELVDLCCGDNRLIDAYDNRGVGVDISSNGRQDIVVASDFTNLPFDNGITDSVTIIASLNYFEDPVKVLDEVHRILREHGRLVITMSNTYIMRIWHLFRERWANESSISKKQLIEIAEKSGFKLLRKKSFMLYVNTIYLFERIEK